MLKDLSITKQSQLANTLMKTILTYLTPKDFNIFPNPNSYTYDKDFYSSSQSTYPMTKMGTPSKDLLLKFYNKCNAEYKQVLDEYYDEVIIAKRLLTLQEAQQIRIYQEWKGKQNDNKRKTK